MIPNKDKTIAVTSTVEGEAVAMGIRAEDMGVIMGHLIDLYKDKVLAVVREYSTNARDAQVDSGVQRPIEITLPKRKGMDTQPYFKVRDYGTGMSVEDIHQVYSQYGRSTKRESNDFNGQLGLGGKSGLTYAQAFTVTSVKNGTKITVEVRRDLGGAGTMTTLDTVATTEHTGTTITIPVATQDFERFGKTAREFFSYWPEGSVLIDGQAPKRFKGEKLTDELWLVQPALNSWGGIAGEQPTSRVVMGGVAYPAPQLDGFLPSHQAVVAFVPIGAVDFVPSREALMEERDSQTTADTIKQIKLDLNNELAKKVQATIDAQTTALDALQAALDWLPRVPESMRTKSYKWRGIELPLGGIKMTTKQEDHRQYDYQTQSYKTVKRTVPAASYSTDRGGALSDCYACGSVQAEWLPNAVWVEDYDPSKFVAQHKHKLRKWCADQGFTVSSDSMQNFDVMVYILLDGKVPASDFIPKDRVVSWSEVRKIKLDPKPRPSWRGGTPRIPGSYDVYIDGKFTSGKPGSELPSYPMFYMHGNRYEVRRYAEPLAALLDHSVIVCLPLNRIEKFKRDVPTAKHVEDGIKTALDGWLAKLTDDDKLAFWLHDLDYARPLSTFRLLDKAAKKAAGTYADKDLREAIRISKLDISKKLTQREGFDVLGSKGVQSKTHKRGWKDSESPLKKYPLLTDSALRDHPVETFNYINDAFKRI